MPEPNKDELADALARLASGEAPSAPDGIPSEQVPLTPQQEKPKRPVAPSAPSVPGAASPAQRSNPGLPSGAAKEARTPPSTGRVLPKPAPAPVPKAPAPQVSPRQATSARPARPAAPVRREAPQAPPRVESDAPPAPGDVIDDDDTMAIPAPEPGVFKPRPAPPRPKRQALHARLEFRRTMIPILLTMGIALPACAVWWIFLDPDSPLKSMSVAYPITLACVGAVMLALAILNMLQVKQQLADAARR